MIRDGRVAEAELPSSFLDLLDRERRYRAALREWQQHQEWMRNRNPIRAELERLHGYDTKHAMHLIRLLRMAVEILSTGEVHVRRRDAEVLLAIRKDALSFEALLEQAEHLGSRLRALSAASPLPPVPDEHRLNALWADLVSQVHERTA